MAFSYLRASEGGIHEYVGSIVKLIMMVIQAVRPISPQRFSALQVSHLRFLLAFVQCRPPTELTLLARCRHMEQFSLL